MKRSDFRFLDRLRVRWAEIDSQNIVFNGHYMMYLDTAVAGYWRALAMPYAQAMAQLGGDIYVRKATLEYHASARYEDMLDVGMRCGRVGTSSMVFSGAVFRQDTLLVSGELVYVFADPATQTSKPVPPQLRALFEAYEAGEPMVEVRVGRWAELGDAARTLRAEVFVDEQKVPIAMEWDGADEDAVHAVALNRFGMPLATGRLLAHAPGVAKIGRMAVRQNLRGGGMGREVLDALLNEARARGDMQAVLHAQTSAAHFYERAGFVARGAEFEEAGIAHIEMVRDL